ncbi:MAG: hypothetical protein ABI679_00520 [Gemmatimonadota bacterium]
MNKQTRIALVGDHNPAVIAHQGIQRSLEMAGADMPDLAWDWVHTTSIGNNAATRLAEYSGIWVVPASPYTSTDGAFAAIRHARETPVPFLGTCGGFQHAVLEYVHSVLLLPQAEHGESAPGSPFPLISPLTCSLVETKGGVKAVADTRFAGIYGAASRDEGYHCSFGLNPQYENLFGSGPLRIAARDETGEVRAMELEGHPFYIITLFQPERSALRSQVHPLILAFLHASAHP